MHSVPSDMRTRKLHLKHAKPTFFNVLVKFACSTIKYHYLAFRKIQLFENRTIIYRDTAVNSLPFLLKMQILFVFGIFVRKSTKCAHFYLVFWASCKASMWDLRLLRHSATKIPHISHILNSLTIF